MSKLTNITTFQEAREEFNALLTKASKLNKEVNGHLTEQDDCLREYGNICKKCFSESEVLRDWALILNCGNPSMILPLYDNNIKTILTYENSEDHFTVLDEPNGDSLYSACEWGLAQTIELLDKKTISLGKDKLLDNLVVNAFLASALNGIASSNKKSYDEAVAILQQNSENAVNILSFVTQVMLKTDDIDTTPYYDYLVLPELVECEDNVKHPTEHVRDYKGTYLTEDDEIYSQKDDKLYKVANSSKYFNHINSLSDDTVFELTNGMFTNKNELKNMVYEIMANHIYCMVYRK